MALSLGFGVSVGTPGFSARTTYETTATERMKDITLNPKP